MSNAILRVLVCLSLLVVSASAAALPPVTPVPTPPQPPLPPTPVAQPVVAPPPIRVPAPTSVVFWIQCPYYYLPTNVGTVPGIAFAASRGPEAHDAEGRLIANSGAYLLAVTRYADAYSSQFAAVVNRMPAGCTVDFFEPGYPINDFHQRVVFSAQLVGTSNGIDPKTQRQTETLHFTYDGDAWFTVPAQPAGQTQSIVQCHASRGGFAQSASCASGQMCVMPQQQQNFCL